MHEDGRGCIFRGKVVLRHPLRNSGSKPYHLSTKTGELQLKEIRDTCKGEKRDFIQGEINYFEENEERMHYDQYRAMHLPIGSGTVESSCKNVIGGRMKQGGMTWSESGAEGMLQIRTSLCSERFQKDFRQTLRLVA